ncbi:MAG: Nuclease (SNase domain protein) [Candidatus Collierbacteria bacterium GW2011_GWA1_42_60]|uniref:Nuclease (SNase domain protein) n=1 Tax=Candidatus Collierbacteria bacterium GW2011_GWA2_42_17 TaxID=1618378 RepID=A0A0G1BAB1_9BACT|nr:MAG: Nuclease (SNase domain protein) [Candidatus Collierbacteria bacterium GW2011_GWB2_42_12]KKS43276.1 MAG: Nuclease (SNase domain protein) [Candidatus Collierbacteria bacterium GW2011_GWA2_42_17]KKS62816.1 MAG: Nuclease (SNase domain protein) [Candidatus Collierbacteria bacterium GW2011_GWE2_42_48]KKS63191.1 MAG: Nuclease (SNase domain protein) [Candidatus Collierbacteria bacterium GW2011_GWD2_42_50]KKS65045.1 MAG: Nuclease (SNase domain protein) [Candidatus Collierbacteria bacterium GW201
MPHSFLISLLLGSFFFFSNRSSAIIYDKVVEVVDGDTFFIQNRQPIRLYGVNTPELGNCYSEESKNELTKMLLGKEVRLSRFATACRRNHLRAIPLLYPDCGRDDCSCEQAPAIAVASLCSPQDHIQ